MEENRILTLINDGGAARLDAFISASEPTLTRSAAQRIIDGGGVLVNGKRAQKSCKVKSGDRVTVEIPDLSEPDVEPENIPLEVVFEDEHLLVVNKPKGMVVHPAPGHYSGTLVNALMYRCAGSLSGINGVRRPGIVHRIDRDTSGLLVVAKTDEAHLGLADMIARHDFRREYLAVTVGRFKNPDGVIELPIGRSPKDRKLRAVGGSGAKPAVTHYRTEREYDGFALVRFTLETGRTHQIRVHSAYMGHPIAGDTVYGGARNDYGLHGQCLHAAVLGFTHPVTGEELLFESPLPEYFTAFLNGLTER